ncbi:hypothetical protein U9M48_018000 [Paspalum notatum var. saurae]|uniref:Uncharacterized protein n=1 Tax=Paspalum notatum var. saurae TaxID=547442 RepID=A0AAQ3TCK4_PASNO
MFRYADRRDVLLMLVGTVAALANGMGQPIMTVIFGQVINAFGGATTDTVLHRVNKAFLCLHNIHATRITKELKPFFRFLSRVAAALLHQEQKRLEELGGGITSKVSCWTITGERQATRIRSLYLKSVLRQDIAFFDVEMTTGQVVSRMSGDTVLVQDAIGEKVGKFLQLVATFIGGFVIAFVKGWLLSLVMLACLPPVVFAGGVVSKILSKISSKGQASYSDAGNVVEQTIGAIKTVASFNGEKQAIAVYNKLIHKAYKATVEEGITNGFGMGYVTFIFFSSYGLAIWYGGKLILSRGYLGEDIINILMAVMTGAMSLGNATPCLAAFAEGQSAGYRLLKTIKRKPHIDTDDTTGTQLEDVKGDVDLKDVYFSYPARPEQLIFDGFSLHVSSGTTMAIVGESGSGKSTAISLVQRFYDPQADLGETHINKFVENFMVNNFDNWFFDMHEGSVEFLEGNDTNRENQKHAGDHDIVKKAPMGQLASLNKPELPIILLGSLAAGVHGVLLPMFGLMISSAIKTFYEPEDQLRRDSSFWGLMCVLLGVISIISIPIEQFLFGIAGGKLIERIRSLSFRHIVHQEIAWFDDPKNSRLEALFNHPMCDSTCGPSRLCTNKIFEGFQSRCQDEDRIRVYQPLIYEIMLLYEDASQVATDAVSNIRTVAAYSAEKRVMTMYSQKCKVSKKQGITAGIVGGLGFGFAFLILYVTFGICFYVGAQFVRHNKSTFGDVFKVFFALMVSTIGMARTSAMASDSTKAKDSTISLFDLLDRKSEIDSSSDVGLTMGEVKGIIDFQNVSFKYPSRPDVQIFNGFTLHIPDAKTVALVGESGSGKSTVISLLERFYNPDSGRISLDGVELKNLKINWLRDQMGLVSQEPVLFNDTIHANIAYGKREEVTEEELIKVAKAANAHEFISSLPRGYDTTVGERGVQLSGGQKQRVAIARAILKDPRILLLDEATSALDAESERIVQDALDHVMVGRTTVIVAHRLSTIKGADIIAVLKEGAIVEKGRHEALMNIKDGVYASLVELRTT